MTKAQERMWENYKMATAQELHQVYGSYSAAKAEAMNYCKRLQNELGGWDGRICSANTFQFTYAFQYKDGAGDVCLCYITKSADRKFLIA